MDIKILVAAHKKYRMPTDHMYIPVHVGKEGKEDLGYVGDNTGDSISIMNPRLCELTGVMRRIIVPAYGSFTAD